MQKTRLLFVYPTIECSATATHTYSLPLGLGSIATYCRDKLQDCLEIKILDVITAKKTFIASSTLA